MSKSVEYRVNAFQEAYGNSMVVKLPKEFRELLLEMTLAYLVDQPEDIIEFATNFLSEKKLERAAVFPDFSKPRVMKNRHVSSRRFSVLAEPISLEDEDFHPLVYFKTEAQQEKLLEAIDRCKFFQSLDSYERKLVLDAMKMRTVESGEIVIQQGTRGDHFYVVEKGVFQAVDRRYKDVRVLKTYDNSGCFGELALMYNTPRACTVVARTDGVLWALDRGTFRRAVLRCSYQKRKMHEMLIDNVPMFQVLEDDERTNLADSLESRFYEDGECIIRQGDEADGMFLVVNGVVKVTRRGRDGHLYDVQTLSSGDYFGELALITYKKRAASVYAVGPVKVGFLCVEAFERLLGRCIDIMKRNIQHYELQMERLERSRVTDFR